MLQYPHINPVAFKLGPLAVHWYGIMYIIGFVFAWLLGWLRTRQKNCKLSSQVFSDLIFYAALGVIVGGRLGYMLFYDLSGFIHKPWIIFQVWDGGMSFHGGMLGVLAAVYWYSRRVQMSPWVLTDFVAPLVPLGLAAGRIGNFINGELWGRVSYLPWAMVFPKAGPLPRHPSQLYEFFFEGVVLFTILWLYSGKPRPRFAVTAMFLLFYGIFRFTIEFVRQPDPQLGFIAFGWLTMGQLLSLPMIIGGGYALWWIYIHRERSNV